MTEKDLIIQSLRKRVEDLLTERGSLQREIDILKMQLDWLYAEHIKVLEQINGQTQETNTH